MNGEMLHRYGQAGSTCNTPCETENSGYIYIYVMLIERRQAQLERRQAQLQTTFMKRFDSYPLHRRTRPPCAAITRTIAGQGVAQWCPKRGQAVGCTKRACNSGVHRTRLSRLHTYQDQLSIIACVCGLAAIGLGSHKDEQERAAAFSLGLTAVIAGNSKRLRVVLSGPIFDELTGGFEPHGFSRRARTCKQNDAPHDFVGANENCVRLILEGFKLSSKPLATASYAAGTGQTVTNASDLFGDLAKHALIQLNKCYKFVKPACASVMAAATGSAANACACAMTDTRKIVKEETHAHKPFFFSLSQSTTEGQRRPIGHSSTRPHNETETWPQKGARIRPKK